MASATSIKKLTKPGKKKIVHGIINLLKSIHCYEGIIIYFDGVRIEKHEDKIDWEATKALGEDSTEIVYIEGKEELSTIDPKTLNPWSAKRYCEYANDDTVTVVFESSTLYEVLNDGDFNPFTNKFSWNRKDKFDTAMAEILKPYGLHYELGNSWNLSLYE